MGNIFCPSFCPPDKKKARALSKNVLKKKKKKKDIDPAQLQAWKARVQDFSDKLLDPSFLTHPVRANTIDAGELYPSDHNTLMPGSHKHLGGAYDPTDGGIYGVPANSKSILAICPDENGTYQLSALPLPPSVAALRMKWLRGIFAHGYLWAIPSWAPAVLCVDIDAWRGRRSLPEGKTDYVELIDLPQDYPKPKPGEQIQWQWHGAGLNRETTAAYCIPSNAKDVLKVDMVTKTTSLIPIDTSGYDSFDYTAANKWYGGIMGEDNCCYGIPYRSCAVLKIDCNKDTAKLIGPEYPPAQYHWHGGIQRNGKIYAHPSHADTVLVIDTRHDDRTPVYELPIERTDDNPRKNYKWLGGAVGADGNIYCPACDTSPVLKINTKTDECKTYGFCGTEKNKWQGGLFSSRDGCIYCIPANGKHILRIATTNGDEVVQLVGDLPEHKDKWQGGSEGKDGSLYFVPENGYRVLKVTPPEKPPVVVDGELPENDVKIEFI